MVSVRRENGAEDFLPLNEAKKFQLYAPEQVALAKGDRLRITMNGFASKGNNDKGRLDNGTMYQVEGFTRQGDIRLSNGLVLPRNYGGITHGYVVTSHASQGKTVDTVLIALGSESLAAANREQFYVSVSRGRHGVRLYTDDKDAVLDAVKNSGARLSAMELMQSPEAKPKRNSRSWERTMQIAQRAYREKFARIAASEAQQQNGRA